MLIGTIQGVAAMHDGPICGVKPDVRRKYLSADETHRLIDAAANVGRNGKRDKLLLMLMFRHGLRVSEAVDLRWTDFDLDAPRDRPFWVRRLKGSNDSTHTLEPDTAQQLRKARDVADGPYVFRSERGGPLSVDMVQAIVKRAGQVAGLAVACHPHMLRHACGFN
jgi:integrase